MKAYCPFKRDHLRKSGVLFIGEWDTRVLTRRNQGMNPTGKNDHSSLTLVPGWFFGADARVSKNRVVIGYSDNGRSA